MILIQTLSFSSLVYFPIFKHTMVLNFSLYEINCYDNVYTGDCLDKLVSYDLGVRREDVVTVNNTIYLSGGTNYLIIYSYSFSNYSACIPPSTSTSSSSSSSTTGGKHSKWKDPEYYDVTIAIVLVVIFVIVAIVKIVIQRRRNRVNYTAIQ